MSKGGAPRFSEEWLAQRLKTTAAAQPTPPKPSKYRSEKTEVDGVKFDSRAEASRWQQLELMEKAGVISSLQRQVPFELAPAVMLDGRTKPPIRYFADATYMENGALIVEDTKSAITRKKPEYRIKKHLMRHIHGIEIREYQK